MPKNFFLTILLGLSLVLASPLAALGADVIFSEDVNITVGSYSLVIESASRADSIIVSDTTISVSLADNSWFKLKSSDRRYLTNSLANTSCENSQSSVTFSGVSAQTVVITPSATICPAVTPSGGGSSSSSSSSSTSDTTTVTMPTTTNGQVTATAAGGGKTTLATASNTSVEATVPVGAVSTDTTITISAVSASDVSALPSGYLASGSQFFSLAATSGGSSVTSFSKVITVVFSYTAASISGISEDSLKIYRWTGSAWQALGSVVDKTNRKVTASTSNFSYFSLLGTTTSTTTGTTGTTGTSGTTSTTPSTLLPASTTNSQGYTLMKGSGSDVWVIQNGLKTLVRSLDVFSSSSYSATAIKTVSNTSLNAVATASLIKAGDNPDVYLLANNFKRKLASIEIFNSYKLDWNKISTLSQPVMNSFSYAPIYKHGVDLFWRDVNNVLHKFANMIVFAVNGYNTRDLIIINDSEYGSFATGEMITK